MGKYIERREKNKTIQNQITDGGMLDVSCAAFVLLN